MTAPQLAAIFDAVIGQGSVRLVELGGDHPVPYSDEVEAPGGPPAG